MTLTNGITIRSATPEDATAIRTLVATSFGGRPDEDELDRYRQLFPPADAIVAADGARIVGHVQSRTMTVTVPGERAVDA